MGRAVGGASAAGCGAFSLGGLIVGIGLTVWLGSMVMSSTGGDTGTGTGSKDTIPSDQVSSLDSTLDELTAPPGSGLEPSGAALGVPGDLAERGSVAVHGDHLSPGPIDLTTCLTTAGSSVEVAGCDPSTTRTATVDARGDLLVEYPLRRVITVGGTAYDCGARAGGCSIFGHRTDDTSVAGIAASLVFATGLPPVDAVAPPEG